MERREIQDIINSHLPNHSRLAKIKIVDELIARDIVPPSGVTGQLVKSTFDEGVFSLSSDQKVLLGTAPLILSDLETRGGRKFHITGRNDITSSPAHVFVKNLRQRGN